jgi:hypothetical protein
MSNPDDTSYAHYSPTINVLFVSTQLGYLSYRYPVAATATAPKVSATEAAGELNTGYQLPVFPGVIQYVNSSTSNSRFVCLYFSNTRICLLQRLFSIQRIVCQAYQGKQTNQTQCRYVDSAGYQLQYSSLGLFF